MLQKWVLYAALFLTHLSNAAQPQPNPKGNLALTARAIASSEASGTKAKNLADGDIMSLFASNIFAEHVIGIAGDGYRVSLVAGGFEWTGIWDLIILAVLFVPVYLRTKIFTIPEFL